MGVKCRGVKYRGTVIEHFHENTLRLVLIVIVFLPLTHISTQDKKAKKEMPLLGWNIAEPQDCDKVQDVTLTLKVNI